MEKQTYDLERFLRRLSIRINPSFKSGAAFGLADIWRGYSDVQAHQQNSIHNPRLWHNKQTTLCKERERKKEDVKQTTEESFQEGAGNTGLGVPPVRCRISLQCGLDTGLGLTGPPPCPAAAAADAGPELSTPSIIHRKESH